MSLAAGVVCAGGNGRCRHRRGPGVPWLSISLMLLGCCATRAAARQIGSWFEQACGRERPVVDLPDDLLLAGVVLHDVLPGRGGLGRGLALGGSVAIALAGVAAVGKARRARVNRPGSRF